VENPATDGADVLLSETVAYPGGSDNPEEAARATGLPWRAALARCQLKYSLSTRS
jgi:hypothetical protein